MKTRVVIGAILIAALIGDFAIDFGLESIGWKPWAFFALVVLTCTETAREVSRLFDHFGAMPFRSDLFIIGWLALLAMQMAPTVNTDGESIVTTHAILTSGIGVIGLLLLVGAHRVWRTDPEVMLKRLGGTLGVFAYVFVPGVCLLAIRLFSAPQVDHAGLWLVLFIVAVGRLGGDAGAYFVGKAIGKRKLIPAVSPGKTVEGHIGGAICATAVGAICWWLMPAIPKFFSIWGTLGLSITIWMFASSGDLMASAFKRGAGVKDSGKLLPEFGGALDIVDGFLLTAPLIVVVLHGMARLS